MREIIQYFTVLLLAINSTFAAPPQAMFSPFEGVEAFERIYSNVRGAEKTAHLTIYSWSDSGITKAMESLLIKKPSVKLRVVLHRPLAKKESTLKKVAKLEKLGAMFKKAKMNMHEKFVLVDGKKLVNSSANMSSGAKNKYAEDFIFIDSDGEHDNEEILNEMKKEFSILWETAEDIVSPEELQKADTLAVDLDSTHLPKVDSSIILHSSSMNFSYSKYREESSDFKKGKTLRMKKIKLENGDLAFQVSTGLIKAIDRAKKSIRLSLNHFNLYSVSKALIRAIERGVEVRLAVDNQEFKTRIRDEGRKSIEMTPRFVRDWKKLPGNTHKSAPVRVKYYSLAPHFSSWLLNHHKYVLVDIESSSPVLLAGSFNISKNAEFNQFDNLIEFKGTRYADLMMSYKKNHDSIWMMNRTKKDTPYKSTLKKFKKIYDDSYIRLHVKDPKDAMSLTWEEAIQLQKEMKGIAPGLYKNLFRNKGHTYYNFKTETFF